MRFVLSIIASSFFFFSTFQGNAGEVLGKQLTPDTDNCTTIKLFDCSVSDDYAVANINSNHRNYSTTKHRFYPSGNFINAVPSHRTLDFFYKEKLLIQPHLYCKRIGLKLVFPEHYFW